MYVVVLAAVLLGLASGKTHVHYQRPMHEPNGNGHAFGQNRPSDVISQFPVSKAMDCGYRPIKINQHIVGGQDASIDDHYWQVQLRRPTGSTPFCGGSLVYRPDGTYAVITAAHCVEKTKIADLVIGVGFYERSKATLHAEIIPVSAITVHAGYNSRTVTNDIAIVHLSRQPSSDVVRSGAVCIRRTPYVVGEMCVVTGWGTLSSGGPVPVNLQEVEKPIFDHAKCGEAYGADSIDQTMLCAGVPEGGVDSCQGDSGGPFICQNSEGKWELTGIVSWGNGCALPGYPGVYADVNHLQSWIDSNL